MSIRPLTVGRLWQFAVVGHKDDRNRRHLQLPSSLVKSFLFLWDFFVSSLSPRPGWTGKPSDASTSLPSPVVYPERPFDPVAQRNTGTSSVNCGDRR